MRMAAKRKRAHLSDDQEEADYLSYIKQNIFSLCRLGTEKVPGRPALSELKDRIRRAYHPEEAAELLSFVTKREGDEHAFWAEFTDLEREWEPPPPLDAGSHAYIRLLAQTETERHIAMRMLLHEKKRTQKKERSRKSVHLFDSNDSAEKALAMIEALPQGSRGVQAPHTGFLNLGRKWAGDEAAPETQLAFGILLEEYALELLQPHVQAVGSSCGESLSPFMEGSGSTGSSDVSQHEAQMAGRVLEALGVLDGPGLKGQRRQSRGSSVKGLTTRRGRGGRGGRDAEMSSDEYSE